MQVAELRETRAVERLRQTVDREIALDDLEPVRLEPDRVPDARNTSGSDADRCALHKSSAIHVAKTNNLT